MTSYCNTVISVTVAFAPPLDNVQTLTESDKKENENELDPFVAVLNKPVSPDVLGNQQFSTKVRKTKREVLKMRNIDVDQVVKQLPALQYVVDL